MSLLSIIVISHNSHDDVVRLIWSYLKQTESHWLKHTTFIVYENGDNDLIRLLPSHFATNEIQIETYFGPNRGFGAAVNTAVSYASAEHVLLLNPDAIFTSSTSEIFMNLPEINWGTCIQWRNGSIYSVDLLPCAKTVFDELFKTYRKLNDNLPTFLDNKHFPVGAFWLLRKTIILNNQFDENYFMYFEEADLAKRLQKFYDCKILKTVNIDHYTFGSSSINQRAKWYDDSLKLYFRKHGNWTVYVYQRIVTSWCLPVIRILRSWYEKN